MREKDIVLRMLAVRDVCSLSTLDRRSRPNFWIRRLGLARSSIIGPPQRNPVAALLTWQAIVLAAVRNHKESDMNIVAATDFSTRSNRALRQAGLLVRSPDAKLHLVHVVDEDQPTELVRIEEREAQRTLVEQIAAMPELQNIHCYPIVVKGHPFDGILRTAAAVDADLVVMGAHRKQFLRDIFTGTTIERVIRGGKYPVLMVNNEAQRQYERVFGADGSVKYIGRCDPNRPVRRIS
jgi:nucleotide-binding universal stress UspA family protein